MKQILKQIFSVLGYEVRKKSSESGLDFPDMTTEEMAIVEKAMPYSMTGPARLVSLVRSVKYLVENNIKGDFVECGVWRGGSSLAAAEAFALYGDHDREFYLYDTYTGMSEPTAHDKSFSGEDAKVLLAKDQRGTGIWCHASLEDVKNTLSQSEYPLEKFHLVVGKVEDTIPNEIPESVALLRLDTDWYESTRHELMHLFPRLEEDGILIIDDYGHWQGARKAVDEYFENFEPVPFLHRIDYTGRLLVKT